MHLLLDFFENEASFPPKIKFTTDTTMSISISERMKLTQQVCWYSFRQRRTIQKSQQSSTVAENHWWRTKNFISIGNYWTSKLYSIKRKTLEIKCSHWVSVESKEWNNVVLHWETDFKGIRDGSKETQGLPEFSMKAPNVLQSWHSYMDGVEGNRKTSNS